MSFLATRALSSVNKATEDPAAEKKLREQQREAKEAIRIYKTLVIDERNKLVTGQSKKQINKVDADQLLKLLDDISKYLDDPNTITLVKDDIKDKWDDTFNADKYIVLARASYTPGSYPEANGSRFITQQNLKVAKQLRHDVQNIPEKAKKLLDDGITRCEKFLETNIYSRSEIYIAYWKALDEELSPLIKDPEIKGLLDRNFGLAQQKIQKNFELDFEEKPGAPVAGAEARAEAAKVEKFQSDARKDEFSVSRLLSNAANRSVTYIVLGLLLFFACIGSGMAVNLNMYKPMPFKVLYAIYGFLFGFVVVPYVLLYRWYWQGKQPKYYGFIPFVPGFFTKPWVQFLLGWLTYKKDGHIGDTQEWIHHETK